MSLPGDQALNPVRKQLVVPITFMPPLHLRDYFAIIVIYRIHNWGRLSVAIFVLYI